MTQPRDDTPPPAAATGNRYDRMEWAGAFGDLGTLIPFVAAYVGVLRMDPFGVLFAFGVAMLACGLYYKTPFPVQPMKAIGAVAALQAVQTAVVTPAAVYSAALVTGVIWLALGLTGWVTRIARLVPPAVVIGIVLGLGFGFMLQGVKMMQGDWLVAAVAATGTLLLMGSRRIPAMFVLLAFGAVVGALRNPELIARLAEAPVGFRAPQFSLIDLSWNQFWVGLVLLALPQVPLTLGNAVIAIRKENNRLFPHRPVSEDGVAVSTGLMNLFGSAVGGIPMCHGAGGMASHVAFGARTGGSVVILGGLLLVLALFFSSSITLLFQLFPGAVLGVILFVAGLQLALGSSVLPDDRAERLVVLACAALCLWNVGAGFLVGMALHALLQRGWLRL
jgi:MFS superfamily sulfate permease-like transporter